MTFKIKIFHEGYENPCGGNYQLSLGVFAQQIVDSLMFADFAALKNNYGTCIDEMSRQLTYGKKNRISKIEKVCSFLKMLNAPKSFKS